MIEREKLEMDVVFVGAGPANLAAALHLKRLIDLHDSEVADGKRSGSKIGEIQIAVIEKGPFVGAHILSGAVMDPIAIKELMPDFLEMGCPVDAQVAEDAETLFSAAIDPPEDAEEAAARLAQIASRSFRMTPSRLSARPVNITSSETFCPLAATM